MELRIDGEPVVPPEGFDRVGPLIDRVLQGIDAGRRVAAQVWIDGCELDEAAIADLPQRATEGLAQVEVKTRGVEDAARGALAGSHEYAPKIAARLREAANDYRIGDPAAAGAVLAECIDALVVLLETLRAVNDFLAPNGATGTHESGETQATLEALLAPGLITLEERQRSGDWLGAADVIEYELADRLALWSQKPRDEA